MLPPFAASPVCAADAGAPPPHLDLPVVRVADPYPPYAEFCRRQPDQCRLDGPASIRHDAELMDTLRSVSAQVNREVRFALDSANHGVEEYWALPTSGYGDCEDVALAKRARLVGLGYPAGALRLAFVFHRDTMGSHCVLTVETTQGTFLLDSHTDEVERWSETPYNFEARERRDGRWDRYDQSGWHYDNAVSDPP